ncbi:QacE family quaternary ammonium compound efflux SMR transporter, partial [Bacillus vallismortis]|nr:QacE family quaternary ammonium compound efflux SMR transporter [Bacillus vallismortis]
AGGALDGIHFYNDPKDAKSIFFNAINLCSAVG